MSRIVVVGFAYLLVISFLPVAIPEQDDVIEFLRKVEEKTYYPQDKGVQSLSADVEFSITPEMPGLEDISIKTYFKMPDKRATKIEGLPDDPGYEDLRELIEGISEMLVPETLDEEIEENDFEMEDDGNLVKVTKTAKPGTDAAKHYREVITWYGEDFLPVKGMGENAEGQTFVITDFKLKERDGKYLLRSMSADVETEVHGTVKLKLSCFYKNIDGVWLLSKVKRKIVYEDRGGMGVEFVFKFKNYELNGEIDDEIFTKPEEEEEDDENEEGQEFDEEW